MITTTLIPTHQVAAVAEVLPLRRTPRGPAVVLDAVTAAVLSAWVAIRADAGVSWELRTALDALVRGVS